MSKKTKQKMDISYHVLVPKHEIMTEEEVKNLFDKVDISKDQLPKILNTDPVCESIGAKPGHILKITRKSHTANEAIAYRFVVESSV